MLHISSLTRPRAEITSGYCLGVKDISKTPARASVWSQDRLIFNPSFEKQSLLYKY